MYVCMYVCMYVWSKLENQQTQPTRDAKSGNQTVASLMGKKCLSVPSLLPYMYICGMFDDNSIEFIAATGVHSNVVHSLKKQ